jgi:elongation factor Tu
MDGVERGPDVEAEVTFLSTEAGGRMGPVQPGYRPAHRVLPDYLTTGVHTYPERDWVSPGETVRACIRFITPEAYPNCLRVGQTVEIQEGSHVVGHATIVRIINKALEAAG